MAGCSARRHRTEWATAYLATREIVEHGALALLYQR